MNTLPLNLRRRIAEDTHKIGWGVTNDALHDRQRQCNICGICLSNTRAAGQCTLFDDPNPMLTTRDQTPLCKAMCIGRQPLRMLTKLLRNLIAGVYEHIQDRDGCMLRVSLQRDLTDNDDINSRWARPYVFHATFFDDFLELSLMLAHGDDETHKAVIQPYTPGQAISLHQHFPEYRSLNARFEREWIEGDGAPHTLLVQCHDLPQQRDIDIAGLVLTWSPSQRAHIARPMYLFVQAPEG